MEYKYSQEGYHPKTVSFEVEALLLDEAKAQAGAAIALQNTILTTSPGSFNCNWESYPRELELAFNPLTNQEATCKYTEHGLANSIAYGHYLKRKEEEKNRSIWKLLSQLAFRQSMEAFSSVIQNMLRQYVMAHKFMRKHKDVHINFLEIDRVRKVEMMNYARKYEINRAKYTIHPHVQALLNERAMQHGRGRSI